MQDISSILWVLNENTNETKALSDAFTKNCPYIRVTSFNNQIDLLNALKNTNDQLRPNLAILEYMVKGLNIIEILREREKHESYLSIPFLVLTNQFDQRILDACRQAGAENTIPKPGYFVSYVDLIRELVRCTLSNHDNIPEPMYESSNSITDTKQGRFASDSHIGQSSSSAPNRRRWYKVPTPLFVDPVCGKTVLANKLFIVRNNITYYFCTTHCHRKFMPSPIL